MLDISRVTGARKESIPVLVCRQRCMHTVTSLIAHLQTVVSSAPNSLSSSISMRVLEVCGGKTSAGGGGGGDRCKRTRMAAAPDTLSFIDRRVARKSFVKCLPLLSELFVLKYFVHTSEVSQPERSTCVCG